MKPKNDYIGLRVSPDDRNKYLKEAVNKGYRNLSQFVLVCLEKNYKKVRKINVILFLLFSVSVCYAEIDLDRWADAIFKAEGKYSATYLYGIRSIPYKDEAEARQICKNTA